MDGQPIFTDLFGVMAVITMVPVFFLWLEKKTKWKVFDFLPAIIWIFLTPILLSNLFIVPGIDFAIIPRSSDVYTTFRAFAVPMFIVLMLLDIDIKRTLQVAWRGAGVLVVGAVGVAVGCVVAFVLFRSGLPDDAWSGFGALAGSWIGGTGNLAAVAESLQTPEELIGIVVVVDNLVYLVYFPLILGCKRWAASFNRFTGVTQAEIDATYAASAEVEKKRHEVTFPDLLILVAFAFAAILAANWLAPLIPEVGRVLTQSTYSILLVTTFGILLSATPLKDVPGTEPVAMALVYIYMTMIGASADLAGMVGAQWFVVAGFLAIAIHLVFVIVAAKLFRVDVSMAAVSSVASVGGAASAPVAAAYHREELVPISIMLALIGYALGNYLGVATAYLANLIG
ncbi:MAG TPA: DUF819 family protein [Gemmatimonadota bacterium]|nr:DUF819 family protein [Gemmatimonadota bacterium]